MNKKITGGVAVHWTVLALAMRWDKRAKLYHNAGERTSDPLKAIANTLRSCANELRVTVKKR